MKNINSAPLPEESFLHLYKVSGAYTDCYSVGIDAQVSHAEFVQAFYTSTLFKLERFILGLLAARPSNDQQARDLAEGGSSTFAVWTVEKRDSCQLLLREFTGSTRSWLMVEVNQANNHTRLYFGSAVVPQTDQKTGEQKMGWIFKRLLGFHKLYSKALLYYAVKNIEKAHSSN